MLKFTLKKFSKKNKLRITKKKIFVQKKKAQ